MIKPRHRGILSGGASAASLPPTTTFVHYVTTCRKAVPARIESASAQLFSQPLQAVLEELAVFIVAQRADPSLCVPEVLTGLVEIAQLAVAFAQVEV